MAGRSKKLTAELITEICDYIRQGSYDYVACERVGISQSTFYLWLQQAEAEDADPPLLEFSESVEQARAEARTNAEMRVLQEQPATWLLKGPGREKPGRPGWTNENVVTVNTGDTPIKLTWSDADENEAATDPATTPAPSPTAGAE
jgi:transposase-like protein